MIRYISYIVYQFEEMKQALKFTFDKSVSNERILEV